MNREDLRHAVYDRCGVDTDDGLLTADVVNRFVNSALHLIAADEDWPWLRTSTTITTDGSADYAMPDGWLKIRGVRIDGDLPMTYYDKLELDQRWPLASTVGRPSEWCDEGDRLLLRPIPSGAFDVVVDYLRQEPELGSDSDTPLMPYTFHDAIVERAAVLAFRRTGEDGRAQAAMVEYAEWRKVAMKNGSRFRGPGKIRIRPGNVI